MATEFDDQEKISPYDLDAIGRMRQRERGIRDAQLAAAHAEVRRRIQRLKESGDLNPYDLGQTAYIFEPVNRLDQHHF